MDLTAQAQSRVAWQYRNAEKFRSLIDILPDIAQGEIEDVLESIAGVLDADEASGPFLDVLGRVVQQGRTYRVELDSNPVQWGQGAAQFGAGDTYFKATSESIEQGAEDALYRLLLKAKIARNVGDATLDNIAAAMKFFLSVDNVQVNDNENMSFEIQFNEPLTAAERFILQTFDVVPRPMGVMFSGFVEPALFSVWGGNDVMFGAQDVQFGSSSY